tara:strand:+ start:659 stop:1741 length:1083 start_codon:yes stop_codon:yes gene_type:complete
MGVYTTINDPSAYFQTKIYTGNGSSNHAITFDGSSNLQPDWIWNKSRSIADSHALFDSSRGVNKILYSNATLAEGTDTNGNLESFDSNGITVGGNQEYANKSGSNQVTWAWKANGGTTATNTDGATNGYNTTVQANQTAGFSIVQWNAAFDQGNGRYNLGHGLGKIADFIVIKNRSATGDWYVHHKDIDNNDYLRWNLNNATSNTGSRYTFYRPDFTTSIFNVDYNNIVTQNHDYVAYVFATIQGYSKFGKYVGNGNDNGSFIYTGFKPAWLIIKRLDAANNWFIIDTKRDDYQNPFADLLIADGTDAENANTARGDLLSNGFKWRVSANAFNANGGQYIYAAFAESPFVSSAGVPTTAK